MALFTWMWKTNKSKMHIDIEYKWKKMVAASIKIFPGQPSMIAIPCAQPKFSMEVFPSINGRNVLLFHFALSSSVLPFHSFFLHVLMTVWWRCVFDIYYGCCVPPGFWLWWQDGIQIPVWPVWGVWRSGQHMSQTVRQLQPGTQEWFVNRKLCICCMEERERERETERERGREGERERERKRGREGERERDLLVQPCGTSATPGNWDHQNNCFLAKVCLNRHWMSWVRSCPFFHVHIHNLFSFYTPSMRLHDFVN